MDVAASAVAALVSAVAAAVLLARGIGRRRAHLVAWGVSLALFAVGCAAILWGSAASWTPAVFRTYYLAGAVLTVPILGLGSVWLLAPRVAKGLTVVVLAFCVVAALVVLTAGTRHPVPAHEVPEGRVLFDPPPRVFAVVGNVAGTLLVVGGTVGSIVRIVRRRRAGAEGPLDRRYLQANVLITVGVLAAASGGLLLFLGEAASKSVPLALAAVLIFAGYLRTVPGPRDGAAPPRPR